MLLSLKLDWLPDNYTPPTLALAGSSDEKARKLGLGIGLGLGIPALLAIAGLVLMWSKYRCTGKAGALGFDKEAPADAKSASKYVKGTGNPAMGPSGVLVKVHGDEMLTATASPRGTNMPSATNTPGTDTMDKPLMTITGEKWTMISQVCRVLLCLPLARSTRGAHALKPADMPMSSVTL